MSMFDHRIDVPDAFEHELAQGIQLVQSLWVDSNPTPITSHQQKAQIMDGLLFNILTGKKPFDACWNTLSLAQNDNFVYFTERFKQLLSSINYSKIAQLAKKNIIKVFYQLVAANVIQVGECFMLLLRQIKRSDTSSANVNQAKLLLDIILKKEDWFNHLDLAVKAEAVLTFLRISLDHNGDEFSKLQNAEISFVVKTLRAKFFDLSMSIGRDLIRLLLEAAKFPEIESLLQDIAQRPETLDPNFKGISQILATTTPIHFLECMLTPEMVVKLKWIFANCGASPSSHAHQVKWFIQSFLKTCSNELIYCDVIRFICSGIIPTNKQLVENVKRHVFIMHMLKFLKNFESSMAVKVALLYDWLFYNDQDRNLFMRLEPVVLLLSESPYQYITEILLFFFNEIKESYIPNIRHFIAQNVLSGFQSIVSKGVIRDFNVLYDKLPDESKVHLALLLPGYTDAPAVDNSASANSNIDRDAMAVDAPELAKNEVDVASIFAPVKEAIASNDRKAVLLATKAVLVEYAEMIADSNTAEFDLLLSPLLMSSDLVDLFGSVFFVAMAELYKQQSQHRAKWDHLLRRIKSDSLVFRFLEFAIMLSKRSVKLVPRLMTVLGESPESCLLPHLTNVRDLNFDEFYVRFVKASVQYPKVMVGSLEFLKLAFSQCDAQSNLFLSASIGMDNFKLFGDDTDHVFSLLRETLSWPSFDQQGVWMCAAAEFGHQPDFIDQIWDKFIGMIDLNDHVEAVYGAMAMTATTIPKDFNLCYKILGVGFPKRSRVVLNGVFMNWASRGVIIGQQVVGALQMFKKNYSDLMGVELFDDGSSQRESLLLIGKHIFENLRSMRSLQEVGEVRSLWNEIAASHSDLSAFVLRSKPFFFHQFLLMYKRSVDYWKSIHLQHFKSTQVASCCLWQADAILSLVSL